MERSALPGVAPADAVGSAAVGVRGLRRRLEPVALRRVIAAHWCEAAAWASTLAAMSLFAGFATERHRNFHSTAYDFGFFDQIVWNTSEGRWFETSFVAYNFLGQHVEPVLIAFAGAYRLGAPPDSMLATQAALAGLAAMPLFYATRRLTGMPLSAMSVALAYLLSVPLHRGLDFDFHPEMMSFFFAFSALYFIAAERPWAAVAAALPVLLLKEDMAVIALMLGVLLWARGWRRPGGALVGIAIAWGVFAVFVLMPAVRGGGSDLNERFAYLTAGTSPLSVVPVAAWRGSSHLASETLAQAIAMLLSAGGVAVATPAVLLAVPSAALNGLSDHPQQAQLDLQYGAAPLAMLFVATAISLGAIARGGSVARIADEARARRVAAVAAALVAVCGVASFAWSSPYVPWASHYAPDDAHRQTIREAMRLIPADADVSAQNTLLPHLSQRRYIFEFPDVPPRAAWVIVDAGLPITEQARADYDRVLAALPSWGFGLAFDRDGVRVFSREVER